MIGLDPLESERLVVHPPESAEIPFLRHQGIDVEIDEADGALSESAGDERGLAGPPPPREKERTASFRFHTRKVVEKPRGRFVSVGKGKAHDRSRYQGKDALIMTEECVMTKMLFSITLFIRTLLSLSVIPANDAGLRTNGRPAGEEPHRPRREDAVRADRRNTLNTAGKSRRALFPMRSEGEVPSEAQGGRSGQGKPTTFLFQASPKEETGSTARTEFEAYKNHRTV